MKHFSVGGWTRIITLIERSSANITHIFFALWTCHMVAYKNNENNTFLFQHLLVGRDYSNRSKVIPTVYLIISIILEEGEVQLFKGFEACFFNTYLHTFQIRPPRVSIQYVPAKLTPCPEICY